MQLPGTYFLTLYSVFRPPSHNLPVPSPLYRSAITTAIRNIVRTVYQTEAELDVALAAAKLTLYGDEYSGEEFAEEVEDARSFFERVAKNLVDLHSVVAHGSPLSVILRTMYTVSFFEMRLSTVRYLFASHAQSPYKVDSCVVMVAGVVHGTTYDFAEYVELSQLYQLFDVVFTYVDMLPGESHEAFQARVASDVMVPDFPLPRRSRILEVSCAIGAILEVSCAICLCAMPLEQTKLNCGHTFCKGCACAWYAKNRSCAMCRAPTTSAVSLSPPRTMNAGLGLHAHESLRVVRRQTTLYTPTL
jgi:hypothetical protein